MAKKGRTVDESWVNQARKRVVITTALPEELDRAVRQRVAQKGLPNRANYLLSLIRADLGLPEKEEGAATE